MYRFNSHGGSLLSQGIKICKLLNLNYNVHADAPTQAYTLSGHMISESLKKSVLYIPTKNFNSSMCPNLTVGDHNLNKL